jgi:hypothetical protein
VWVCGKSYDPQGAIGSFLNIGVQEEGVVVSFRPCSDTDIPVNTVRMVKEAVQVLGSMKSSTCHPRTATSRGACGYPSREPSPYTPPCSSGLFVELTPEAEGGRRASEYLPLDIDFRPYPILLVWLTI